MFNVCPGCGEYRVDKTIEPSSVKQQAIAICPACGHRQSFRQLPLFVLTGPSGAGKSTVTLELPRHLPDFVVLEADTLLSAVGSGQNAWVDHRDFLLRLIKNVAQSGRPVLLSDSAMGVPENVAELPERRYIGPIYRLALVCDESMLAERLRSRPAWRNSSSDEFVREHLRFDRWFREEGPRHSPPVLLYDTTARTVDETVAAVVDWAASNYKQISV